jgi:hypothetical protein
LRKSKKSARIDRLLKERNAIAECEKELLKAAGTLKNITKNLFARVRRIRRQARRAGAADAGISAR